MAPWQGLYLPFLLTHVPRPGSSMATPLDVSPPWYLCYPPSGMLIYVLARTWASHVAIHHLPPQALPSFSSLSTSFRLSLFPDFGHTGRAQFPLPCLLRENLITCPLPLWESGGPITMSPSTAAGVAATSMADTLPLCHTPACGELRAEGTCCVWQQGKVSPLKKNTGEPWMWPFRRASDPPYSLGEGGSPGMDQEEPQDGISQRGCTGDGLLGVKPSVSWLRVHGMNCNHQPINENIQTNKQK